MMDLKETAPRLEFLSGARDQLPLLFAVVPFGLVFGTLARNAGLSPIETQGFSLFVFAGSSQFVAVGLIASGTPPVAIALSILVVNLRHLLYSARMASYLENLPNRWKALLAWLLTDEAFAMASQRYRVARSTQTHWYFLGTGLALWASWQASTAVGAALGIRIPTAWDLDFVLPLMFLSLLMPTLGNHAIRAAAVSAAITSLLLSILPFKLNLLLGALVGVAVGLVVESREPPSQTRRGRSSDEQL